jgi:hypothetical protein
MKITVAMVATPALLGTLSSCGADVCRGSDAKYYNEGLEYHLAKRGVPYRVSGEVVCVSGRNAAELRAAEAQLDSSFHEVADMLKDSCEEEAFAKWATAERLRFDIRDTKRADDSPGGRMFLLRSFTPEEVAENRRRLSNDAPIEMSCAKEERR